VLSKERKTSNARKVFEEKFTDNLRMLFTNKILTHS
jgi:hypothetical protein